MTVPSTATVTLPLVPPPVKPVPAVTPVIVPTVDGKDRVMVLLTESLTTLTLLPTIWISPPLLVIPLMLETMLA